MRFMRFPWLLMYGSGVIVINMPRQARIDAPSAVHHIICRGIERRKIFLDDADRHCFIDRLGRNLLKSSTSCYAWTLMPNHFHLLLQTGRLPISTFMHRLLTGHAVYFNHRHKRVGHLFQNRYKSILCQLEPYFLELVRYIHLNPLRGRLVKSMGELSNYAYSGHSRIMHGGESWQETHEVLCRFASAVDISRPMYERFVEEGIAQGKRPDLVGGGLLRSCGGWKPVMDARKFGVFFQSDERILGDSDFVTETLEAAKELGEEGAQGTVDLDAIALRVAELTGIDARQVFMPGKQPVMVLARSLLCYWATRNGGISETKLAKSLGVAQSSVSRSVERGERFAESKGWTVQ